MNVLDKLGCLNSAVKCMIKKEDRSSLLSSFNIPNMEDFIIQGISNIKGNLFITAYAGNKDKDSKLFIFSDNKLLKNINLYNNSHVGGITYDDKHNIVWITDKAGALSGYNLDKLLLGKVEPLYKKVYVGDGLLNVYGFNACAYVSYYNNKLYVGNYNTKNKSVLKEYSLLDDGNIDVDNYRVINFTDTVQGIAFYEYENTTYLLVSSSVGRYSKSKLSIFNYDSNSYRDNELKCIYLPPMMENITILDNKLVCAFECNAYKYRGNKHTCDDVLILNLLDIIKTVK